MYEDFYITDRWSGGQVHCIYQSLIMAISTRHADAVDVKFLVEGRPVWVALPHAAWAEYNQRTGKVITDPLAVQIAGHYLKEAIESGFDGGRELHALSVDQFFAHMEKLAVERAPAR